MHRSELVALEVVENPSALSPKCHQLICQAGLSQSDTVTSTLAVTAEGLLDIQLLETLLPDAADSYEHFLQCTTSLAPVFQQAEKRWANSEMVQKFMDDRGIFKWTSSPKLLLTAYTIIKDNESLGPVLSILLSTAVLERSLGDLYVHLVKGCQTCPSMLKDLLTTPELGHILGSTMIKLLRVIMGPPISLNLRNVTWHGFPSPGEISPRYAYMLISITATIGAILNKSRSSTQAIIHQPFLHFQQMSQLQNIYPAVNEDCLLHLSNLFENSPFVVKSMKPFWQLALDRYQQKRFGECVVILLPQLEHGMRRLFAAVNKCPERVLTAEDTVFCTFDEILNKDVSETRENRLRAELGDSYLTLLLDILAYPEGPRLRDRVSHGETDLETVPQNIADYIICTCAAFCLVFLEVEHPLREIAFMKAVHTAAQNYQAVFHPVSQLRKQITEVAASLERWASFQRAPPDEIETIVPWHTTSPSLGEGCERTVDRSACHLVTKYSLKWDHSSFTQPLGKDVTTCVESHFAGVSISTLYRYNSSPSCSINLEEELVGLLRRVLTTTLGVSEQIEAACKTRLAQWTAKELRSRQRNTYRRMLDSIPEICEGLQTVLLTVLCNYCTLDSFSIKSPRDQQATVRFLKSMLQYCENLQTFTSLEKNKWAEASVLTAQLLDRILHF